MSNADETAEEDLHLAIRFMCKAFRFHIMGRGPAYLSNIITAAEKGVTEGDWTLMRSMGKQPEPEPSEHERMLALEMYAEKYKEETGNDIFAVLDEIVRDKVYRNG